MSISCKELGMDCDFVTQMYCDYVTQREAEEFVVDSFMRHVHTEHTEDWFEIEEIYQAACSVIREKAA
jgi:predicted small metal-binding protein